QPVYPYPSMRECGVVRDQSIRNAGRVIMLDRSWTAAAGLALAVALAATTIGARAAEYPDWKGQWIRIPVRLPTQPSHDQTKPWGLGQQAPLTPEYQAILEDSIADQARGGQGNYFDHAVRCMPGGMPLMTIAFFPLEFVVTPATTLILV